jgi:hypothetical protein
MDFLIRIFSEDDISVKTENGINYPVVRQNNKGIISKCPFCLKRHTHGVGDGHRLSHCSDYSSTLVDVVIINKLICHRRNGYIIKNN